jgi:hypothetical protein
MIDTFPLLSFLEVNQCTVTEKKEETEHALGITIAKIRKSRFV